MSGADRTVKLSVKELSDAELRATLERLTAGGEAAAAMKLAEYFHRRIRDNLPYDQSLLYAYLEHVLGRLLDGERPDRVFGVRPPSPDD